MAETILLSITAEDLASGPLDDFSLKLDEAQKRLDELSLSAERAGMSVDASGEKMAVAGEMMDKTGEASSKLEKLSSDAEDLGGSMSKGAEDVSKGAESIERDTSSMGDHVGGIFTKLSGKMSSMGLPFSEAVGKMGEASSDLENKSGKLASSLNNVGKVASIGLVAGFVGAAAEGTHLALAYQASTASIAASAGITVGAAKKITDAFLSTAGTTIYSAQTMAEAYKGVAGELGATEGHALNSAQAMQFMSAASDLAEGSGEDLATTTKSLGTVMQVYGINTQGAAAAANVLFNASRMTGQGTDQMVTVVQRLKSQLGVLAPSLASTGTLLVDLAHHGETGRMAMRTVTQAFSTLLKTSTKVPPTQEQVNAAFAQLPTSVQGAARAMMNGQMSYKAFTAASQKLPPAQMQVVTAFSTLYTQSKMTMAQLSALNTTPQQNMLSQLGVHIYTSSGKFVGMGGVISQLAPKLAHLTEAQKLTDLQTLFGARAATGLLQVISAGPQAYEKYRAQVTKTGSAHAAAEKQAQSMKHEMELIKTTIEDLTTKFGTLLLPILQKFMGYIARATGYVMKHKALLFALATLIGGFLTVAIGVFVVNKMAKFTRSFQDAGRHISGLIEKLFSWARASTASGAEVEASTEGVSAAETEMAATSEEAGAASSVALGPIGIAIMALVPIIMLLMKHWKAVWHVIKTVAVDVWHVIKPVVMIPIRLYIKMVELEIKALLVVWRYVWTGIKTVAMTVWNFIKRGVMEEIRISIDIVRAAIGVLGDVWGAVWGGIKAVVMSVWHAIKPIIHAISGGISSITHAVGGIVHGAGSILKGIGLAAGGIVTSPTLAVVGEAGPEAILPLTDMHRSQQILGSVTHLTAGTSSTGAGNTVIVDMRGAQVMTDRDLNILIAKMSSEITKVVVPQGNVVIRH